MLTTAQSTDPDDKSSSNKSQKIAGRRLRKIEQRWRSEVPMATVDITKQREQFWETVEMFGGRPEIWNALKAAIEAGKDNIEMARVILDCAGVIMPTGLLTEIYDETGFKYELPLYVLCDPVNIRNDLDTNHSISATASYLTQRRSQSRSMSTFGASDKTTDHKLSKSLTIRLNSGKDIFISISDSIRTIGDLMVEAAKLGQLDLSEQRILFFSGGQGPFNPEQTIEGLDLDPFVPLQAWIVSK